MEPDIIANGATDPSKCGAPMLSKTQILAKQQGQYTIRLDIPFHCQ